MLVLGRVSLAGFSYIYICAVYLPNYKVCRYICVHT